MVLPTPILGLVPGSAFPLVLILPPPFLSSTPTAISCSAPVRSSQATQMVPSSECARSTWEGGRKRSLSIGIGSEKSRRSSRSEERRVGKECGCRWWAEDDNEEESGDDGGVG